VEVRDAAKGSSLVDDNIEQRQTSLSQKIAALEQARAFYMPGFVPPTAGTDAEVAVDRISLHLPSSFKKTERQKHCSPELIKAETDIRIAAMADALEDLLRQLRARTFVRRFSARNIQGVRGGTRSRDSIAGISRRVDAAAAAYRRHRTAYKTLAGEGEWELTFKALTATDVRGLSEKALSEQELHERYRTTQLAAALAHVALNTPLLTPRDVPGVPDAYEDDDDIFDEEDEANDSILNSTQGGLADATAPGEGRRKISWIWVAGLALEDVKDPQLTDCMTCIFFSSSLADGVRVQHFEWNGLVLRLDPTDGGRKPSLQPRKCVEISRMQST
jgi:hypothetical protein